MSRRSVCTGQTDWATCGSDFQRSVFSRGVPDEPPIFRTGFEAMRTRYEFVLAGASRTLLESAAEEARIEVEACEDRLSLFRPGSTISRINAAAGLGGKPVRIDPLTMQLLQTAAAIHQRSGGVFDPTIGALMKAWGFRDAAAPPLPPGPALGMQHLLLDADAGTAWLRCDAERGTLDLGAIAKGHALDLAAARLRELGVTCGLLHAGTSSILALDAPPGTPGWRIAIAAPPSESTGGDPPGRCGVVTLRHAALGVSAPHGRTVTGPAGQAWGHVMDPRTGKPAATAQLAAAVCGSAAAADAWSTALLVMGTAGLHAAPDEVWARLIVGGSGEILSSVSSGGPTFAGTGTDTQVSWCTLEVGA